VGRRLAQHAHAKQRERVTGACGAGALVLDASLEKVVRPQPARSHFCRALLHDEVRVTERDQVADLDSHLLVRWNALAAHGRTVRAGHILDRDHVAGAQRGVVARDQVVVHAHVTAPAAADRDLSDVGQRRGREHAVSDDQHAQPAGVHRMGARGGLPGDRLEHRDRRVRGWPGQPVLVVILGQRHAFYVITPRRGEAIYAIAAGSKRARSRCRRARRPAHLDRRRSSRISPAGSRLHRPAACRPRARRRTRPGT